MMAVAKRKTKAAKRKSRYQPKFCDQLIAYFATTPAAGESRPTFTGFARLIGVPKTSATIWRQQYPEFDIAYKNAIEISKKLTGDDFLPAGGRPTLYRPEFCQQLIEYFDVEPYREEMTVHPKTGLEYLARVPNDLPTFAGFARKIGIPAHSLWDWGKARPEFGYACERARTMCEHMMVTNMLGGCYDPRSAMFIAKNYTSLRDVQEFRDLTPDQPVETPEEIQQRIDELDKKIEMLKAQI